MKQLIHLLALLSASPLCAQKPTLAANATPSATASVVAPDPVTKAAGDKRLFEFHAEGLEIKAALAAFARANNLNVVPDGDVTGTVTLDVHDLPLEQMLRALLEAHDVSWREEHGLIRVRNTETRVFKIDYLRLSRKGVGKNSATLGSGTSGGGAGGGAGGGGGGGGGAGGGGAGGQGGGTTISSTTSSVDLNSDNTTDFWTELTAEMGLILTAAGKGSLAINKTAGVIQVTDRPSALKRVEEY